MYCIRASAPLLILVLAVPAAAQVPRFEDNSSQRAAGLRALDPQSRLAAATGLQRARPDDSLRQALASTVLQDPELRVRQAAAVALAKMGGPRARLVLTQAGVCDPDPGMRQGLLAYTRRARLQCHQQPDPPEEAASTPSLDSDLLAELAHPSPERRLAAARELTRRRHAQAGQRIWAMISRDPSWKVRAAAVRMLARSYGPQLLPVLQHSLQSDPDARVREVVLEALAFLRAPRSVAWIAGSARVEEVPAVQAAAISALARIGDTAAVEVLMELAAGARTEEARTAAVNALAGLSAHRAQSRPVLARVLKQDKSGKVRAAALRALAEDNSATVCSARAERLRDADAEVRRAVVEQMARCPASLARPALAAALKEDREAAVRRAAAELLIRAGAAKSIDVLGAALTRDKDVALRRRILAALAALTVKERAAPLCEAAQNEPDPELRKAAVSSLQKLPAESAVPALAAVLGRDRVVEVRQEAARLLAGFRDAAAYQALQKAAARDPAPEVRKTALAGATKSPAQRAWKDSLLPQLIDPSPAVRLRAATQLCTMQSPSTYRALILALWTDENAANRAAVARCFGDLDHPLVDIGLSVAHATDTDGAVIHAVEVAQKQRVDRQARLLEKTKSADPDERVEAVRALQPSPSKQGRAVLEQLLEKDPEVKVRQAALVAVARYQDRRALARLNACSQKERDPALRQAMADRYNRLRAYWAAAKAALNVNTLIQDLRSTDPQVRLLAAHALQVLKDRRAFQALREAARSPSDAQLRHAAVVALGTFGDQAIVSASARVETDKAVREALIQLNYLRTAPPDKVIAALASSKPDEVRRGVEGAAIKPIPAAVPWLVRVGMTHIDASLREAAVRALSLYDQPLALWAVRVAAVHDASKRTRELMWRWAVHADSAAD